MAAPKKSKKHTPVVTITRSADPRYDVFFRPFGKKKPASSPTITITKLHQTDNPVTTTPVYVGASGSFVVKVDIEFTRAYRGGEVCFRWTIDPQTTPINIVVITTGEAFEIGETSPQHEEITVSIPGNTIWPTGNIALLSVELVRVSDNTVLDPKTGYQIKKTN